MDKVLTTTTFDINGYKIDKHLGTVWGTFDIFNVLIST